MGEHHVGGFELLVLAAILHLQGDAYGIRIRQEIESRSGRTAAIGAVYTTLSRMQTKSLVRSRQGEPATRGGRAKRYYELTAKGQRTLGESVRSLGNMLAGLDLEWGV